MRIENSKCRMSLHTRSSSFHLAPPWTTNTHMPVTCSKRFPTFQEKLTTHSMKRCFLSSMALSAKALCNSSNRWMLLTFWTRFAHRSTWSHRYTTSHVHFSAFDVCIKRLANSLNKIIACVLYAFGYWAALYHTIRSCFKRCKPRIRGHWILSWRDCMLKNQLCDVQVWRYAVLFYHANQPWNGKQHGKGPHQSRD